MEPIFIFTLLLITVFGIRCFWMVWFLHPETSDKAGQRYTDEALKEFASTQSSKDAIKSRRNMFLAGGIISLIVFIGLIFFVR